MSKNKHSTTERDRINGRNIKRKWKGAASFTQASRRSIDFIRNLFSVLYFWILIKDKDSLLYLRFTQVSEEKKPKLVCLLLDMNLFGE